MRKQKIGILIPDLLGGGAQKVAINLAMGLARERQNSVSLILLTNRGALSIPQNSNVEVIHIGSNRALFSFWPLQKCLRKRGFDHIISHMTYVNILAILASFMTIMSPNLTIVEHSWPSNEYKKHNGLMGKLFMWLIKLVYPFANSVVGVSDVVKEDLRRNMLWNKSKVKRIYSPLLEKALNEPLLEDRKAVMPFPFILGVGRLEKIKNFSLLIEAFSKLDGKYHLVIAGEGSQEGELKALCERLGLSSRVHFIGFLADLTEYYQGAELLVVTSISESLSNVIVEALSNCCRVVTVKAGGTEELVDSNDLGTVVGYGAGEVSRAIEENIGVEGRRDAFKEKLDDFTILGATEKYASEIRPI